MIDLLGDLQDRFGHLSPRSTLTRVIGETNELRRIRDLPRRHWDKDPDLDRLTRLLTRHLRHTDTPCTNPNRCEGCKAKTLKPVQAVALREAYERGLVGALRPGAGKTLVSLLLPGLLKAEKPLLLVPADLVEKTLDAARQYARHWRVMPITVRSYQFMSHPNQLEYLEGLKPDLIMLDESHMVKNSGSKTWRRINKYAKKHPTKIIPMSGSIAGRSLRECWHYTRAALGQNSPMPKDPMEMASWAYAMDEKVPPEARFDPGALLSLARTDPDLSTLDRARVAFRERFTSTKGVVSTLEDVPPAGLRINLETVDLPQTIQDMLVRMRREEVTPGGEQDVMLALEFWRHARYLACGFYTIWDPPAPAPWRHRRKEWQAFVREKLPYARSFDSVVHLVERIEDGRVDDRGLYARWKEIEPTFKPNPRPVWVSDHMVDKCAAWLDQNPAGLVWAEFPEFGQRVASKAQVPFFHQGGLDARGILVDNYHDGPAVVSGKACGTGHNLQQWHTNLIPVPLSVGGATDQLLARTHRDGQEADYVDVTFLLSCQETYECLGQAYKDAQFAETTLGQPQRLCYAECDWSILADFIEQE